MPLNFFIFMTMIQFRIICCTILLKPTISRKISDFTLRTSFILVKEYKSGSEKFIRSATLQLVVAFTAMTNWNTPIGIFRLFAVAFHSSWCSIMMFRWHAWSFFPQPWSSADLMHRRDKRWNDSDGKKRIYLKTLFHCSNLLFWINGLLEESDWLGGWSRLEMVVQPEHPRDLLVKSRDRLGWTTKESKF